VTAVLQRTRTTVKLSFCVVAALVGMAGCGSCGSTPTANPATPTTSGSSGTKTANLTLPADMCSLVTADEASAAVGTKVVNLAAQGGVAVPGACFYSNPPPSPNPDGTFPSPPPSAGLLVFGQAYPDASTADAVQPDQLAAGYASLYGISNAHAVNGIGDKAFEYSATSSQSGSNGIAIIVFKSNVLLFIVMSPSSDSTKIEALARAAVGKLH
jgi:hypothetical protein